MAYAIVEAGGKQFRVEPGRFYDINRLAVEEDDSVTLDKVLFVSSGDDFHVGQPLVEGATVSGTVMRHLRGPKLIVYKMRPKKKTRKKRGHRQELTRLMIDSISVGGSVFNADEDAEETTGVTDVEAPAVDEPVEEPAVEAAEGEASEAAVVEAEATEPEAAEEGE
ncbi:MAG: 50S ribosomal protein L21 [Cyanobacteria bacterium P01_A01_bin.135]